MNVRICMFCLTSNLRTYSKAFGYKIAGLLPDLPSGVWGLRDPQNITHVSCQYKAVVHKRAIKL